jgi:hypothetical protein
MTWALSLNCPERLHIMNTVLKYIAAFIAFTVSAAVFGFCFYFGEKVAVIVEDHYGQFVANVAAKRAEKQHQS